MYESFFGMEHTPFVRDVPANKLYESNAFRETLGRLAYVADRQKKWQLGRVGNLAKRP